MITVAAARARLKCGGFFNEEKEENEEEKEDEHGENDERANGDQRGAGGDDEQGGGGDDQQDGGGGDDQSIDRPLQVQRKASQLATLCATTPGLNVVRRVPALAALQARSRSSHDHAM